MNEKRFVKLLWVVKASLVVVLVYAGFEVVTAHLHLGSVLNNPDAACGDEPVADEQAAAPKVHSPSDYSGIVQRNLFTGADGTGPIDRSHSPALDSMASAEELGLKLVGAIAGGPAASRAIIQDIKNNTISPYRIGDVVASATIESIQRDAVILSHQGRQLVLQLHTGTSGGKSTTGKEEKQTAAAAAPVKAAVPRLSTQARYIEEVFRKVKIETCTKDNQTLGLKISGLEKVPLAELFGLKNGDVIQSINGQQLTSKQKAFQVLMKAKTQSKVDIQLLRNGKSKDLSFDI
jgi:type II secretion system protein C